MLTVGINQTVRSNATFTDENGAVYDPDSVTFQVQDPTRAQTLYAYGVDTSVVKVSTGVYYWYGTLGIEGLWVIKPTGTLSTGPIATTQDQLVNVADSVF